jgi:DAK2 domain fusion protein YloV
MAAAVGEAHASVERTPSLLPKLAEAGVVDAGGLGFTYILEGMLRHLRGEPLDVALPEETAAISKDWLSVTEERHATEKSLYGFCTEVLVSGSALDSEATRDRIFELGDSVLVIGDDKLIRIHVHTDDPGDVIDHGWSLGRLTHVKVDNIRNQAEQFVAMHQERTVTPRQADTVAVVAGGGIAAVFTTLDCTRIVAGGPTMNPSVGDIVEAAESCPAEDVIVLPNDKNILLAAQEAAGASQKRIHVVPSRSMPQGIAALLALDSEGEMESRISAMVDVMKSVRTIEITRAVSSTRVNGQDIKEGQIIAIVDDSLKAAAPTAAEAILQVLGAVAVEGTSVVTVYAGADVTKEEAERVSAGIRERLPSSYTVDSHYGGQPHYDYIISVE